MLFRIIITVLPLFCGGAANATPADLIELNGRCVSDKDCVLFVDECGVMGAILKRNLPASVAELSGVREDDEPVYTYRTDDKICPLTYVREPSRPTSSEAKCLKNKCVLKSKKSP